MGNLFRSIMLTKILIISVFLIAALVACQGPRGEAGPPGEKGKIIPYWKPFMSGIMITLIFGFIISRPR